MLLVTPVCQECMFRSSTSKPKVSSPEALQTSNIQTAIRPYFNIVLGSKWPQACKSYLSIWIKVVIFKLCPGGSIEESQGFNILERHVAVRRMRDEYVKERVYPDSEFQYMLWSSYGYILSSGPSRNPWKGLHKELIWYYLHEYNSRNNKNWIVKGENAFRSMRMQVAI